MMLAKPKPSGATDTLVERPVETTGDREKEIERRLEMLGDVSAGDEQKKTEEGQVDDLLVLEDEPLPLPIMTPQESTPESLVSPTSAPPVVDQSASAPAMKTNNKNALLARIMAAQERAKQAQQKQMTAPETDKMMEALNNLTTKEEELPSVAPPVPLAVPPPSFDVFEQQMLQVPTQQKPVQPAPPAFDDISLDVFSQGQTSSAPTAPSMETSAPAAPDLMADGWNGLMPVAPPAPAVDENVGGIFDNDVDGSAMSPEEKRKMVEEQRAIMEQIKKDAANNKASEAAIRADAFQSRMVGNRETAASGVDGFSASEVEEQRKILEAIERSKMEKLTMTQEEILQMEEDRKLAEALQMQENEADVNTEYPGNRRAGVAGPAGQEEEKGWWDTISDAIGLGETAATNEAAISTTRPPGSVSQSDGILHHVSRGDEERPEHRGLLDNDNNGPPAARVAESKPLFSCVVDSISNTASALSTGMMGEEEEVHGVDTTSFLSVPDVGRGRENNGSGNYHAIPEHN